MVSERRASHGQRIIGAVARHWSAQHSNDMPALASDAAKTATSEVKQVTRTVRCRKDDLMRGGANIVQIILGCLQRLSGSDQTGNWAGRRVDTAGMPDRTRGTPRQTAMYLRLCACHGATAVARTRSQSAEPQQHRDGRHRPAIPRRRSWRSPWIAGSHNDNNRSGGISMTTKWMSYASLVGIAVGQVTPYRLRPK